MTTTWGIIGAGPIGRNIAKAVTAHGHRVVIANSRGPETLVDLIDELGPLARAATAEDAGAAGDVVVVAVPFFRYREVPVAPLVGKIVLDTTNYYHERDGHFPEIDAGLTTSSAMVQEHLRESKVAKAFNHIVADRIADDGFPVGDPKRRALATASDFPEAVECVESLYALLGMDTVNIGPLSESWRVERDRPAYVVRQNRDELIANLARGTRTI